MALSAYQAAADLGEFKKLIFESFLFVVYLDCLRLLGFNCLIAEKRRLEAQQILEKYPNRVPVIVSRADRSRMPEITQKRFLAPCDITGNRHCFCS
jgi:hypothetical protein